LEEALPEEALPDLNRTSRYSTVLILIRMVGLVMKNARKQRPICRVKKVQDEIEAASDEAVGQDSAIVLPAFPVNHPVRTVALRHLTARLDDQKVLRQKAPEDCGACLGVVVRACAGPEAVFRAGLE
jgi:hypothetical protein